MSERSTRQGSGGHGTLINRVALLLLVGLLAWRLWPIDPPAPPPLPEVTSRPAPPPPRNIRLPVADSIELPPEKTTPEAKRGLGAQVQSAQPHREHHRAKAPQELDLKEQVIALRGGEWQLRLTLSLTSDQPQVMRRAIPLRRRLIEMLYFLVSHRVPESLRTPSGESRLHADLHQRYVNLLRSEEFELHFDSLILEERPPAEEEY